MGGRRKAVQASERDNGVERDRSRCRGQGYHVYMMVV
jgi:hypothetical protein